MAWFDKETNSQLNVSLHVFLFGLPDTFPKAKVINFILLFVKFFIYRQKLFHHGSMDLTHLLRDLRTRLQVERYLTKIEKK